MSIVLDLIILVIFVYCIWQGFKRGMMSALFGIVIIIVTLFASNLISSTFSNEFVPMLKSFISGYVDTQLDNAKDEVVTTEYQVYNIEDILRLQPEKEDEIVTQAFINLGVTKASAEKLTPQVQVYKNDMGESLTSSISYVTSKTLAYLMVFSVSLVLLLIFVAVIANIANITLRIPGKKRVDTVSGSVLGFVRGLMLSSTLAWVLGFAGLLLTAETIKRTVLLEFLMNHNIISFFLKI